MAEKYKKLPQVYKIIFLTFLYALSINYHKVVFIFVAFQWQLWVLMISFQSKLLGLFDQNDKYTISIKKQSHKSHVNSFYRLHDHLSIFL